MKRTSGETNHKPPYKRHATEVRYKATHTVDVFCQELPLAESQISVIKTCLRIMHEEYSDRGTAIKPELMSQQWQQVAVELRILPRYTADNVLQHCLNYLQQCGPSTNNKNDTGISVVCITSFLLIAESVCLYDVNRTRATSVEQLRQRLSHLSSLVQKWLREPPSESCPELLLWSCCILLAVRLRLCIILKVYFQALSAKEEKRTEELLESMLSSRSVLLSKEKRLRALVDALLRDVHLLQENASNQPAVGTFSTWHDLLLLSLPPCKKNECQPPSKIIAPRVCKPQHCDSKNLTEPNLPDLDAVLLDLKELQTEKMSKKSSEDDKFVVYLKQASLGEQFVSSNPAGGVKKEYRDHLQRLCALLLPFMGFVVRRRRLQLGSYSYLDLIPHCLHVHLHLLRSRTALVTAQMQHAFLFHSAYAGVDFQKLPLQECMSSMSLMCEFLWRYALYYRDVVLRSPHWWLQLLLAVMNSIMVKGSQSKELSKTQLDSLCDVANVWCRCTSVLMTSEHHDQVSRVVRLLVESYVVRLCACSTIPTECIYPALKNVIQNQAVAQWLRHLDSHVLAQMSRFLSPAPHGLLRCLVEDLAPEKTHLTPHGI